MKAGSRNVRGGRPIVGTVAVRGVLVAGGCLSGRHTRTTLGEAGPRPSFDHALYHRNPRPTNDLVPADNKERC